MTFEQALTAEIGDILIAIRDMGDINKDDEVIVVELCREQNGISNDTNAWVYIRKNKQQTEANIQSFRFPGGHFNRHV